MYYSYWFLVDLIILLKGKFFFLQEWKKRMELKIQFYDCITCFYMGKQSEEQQKWGECLAYYTGAFNKLNECIKQGKVSTI